MIEEGIMTIGNEGNNSVEERSVQKPGTAPIPRTSAAPERSYCTIVADPPWEYGGFGSSPTSRKDNPRGDGSTRKRPLPYRAMTLQEIKALPVEAMAADDAVLFLWTTSRYLPVAVDITTAWGFQYVQTLVWHKTGNPSPLTGWIAPTSHAEFLVVARRGSPPISRWPSSVISAPAPNCGQHSAKPECFIDHIEASAPGPYLELFARRARFGWDYWGDESLGTAFINQEPEPLVLCACRMERHGVSQACSCKGLVLNDQDRPEGRP